jgi:patatin-like phospholipase/acyl hydrolase
LAELERRFIGGHSAARYFDLISGTSTGGILALGLGAGYTAKQLADLYVNKGGDIFPPTTNNALGRLRRWYRDRRHLARYRYDRAALEGLVRREFGERLFGESSKRLCIPSFEGKHSEVFVFKTPHHPDYQTDRYQPMVNVALATSAAPSYFRPFENGGYTLVDGGVWSNNPILLAVIEALTCFNLRRDQVKVLSIGCGDDRYIVSESQISKGGLWHWKDIMEAAMRLQSMAATNQVRLLLGPPSVIRLDAPAFDPKIRLDDWPRSVTELVPVARKVIESQGEPISAMFLQERAAEYVPADVSK